MAEATEDKQAADVTGYVRPAPCRYEVTWKSGLVETLVAHEVHSPGSAFDLFTARSRAGEHIKFYGEVDGRWRLLLSALPAEVVSVRWLGEVEPAPTCDEPDEAEQ